MEGKVKLVVAEASRALNLGPLGAVTLDARWFHWGPKVVLTWRPRRSKGWQLTFGRP